MYQVGGSLRLGRSIYIERQADVDLYQALLQGEFCYILSARQVGKSSLRIYTKQRLQAIGVRCASVDLTRIGSTEVTPQQWYKGLVLDLMRGFGLLQTVNFKSWWDGQKELSGPQQLSQWIDDVLLPQTGEDKLVILIDEIDSVLSLPFSPDDFFAWIRACYNQRSENPAYGRLTFALFGVATPSDLIADRTRTPFNLGRAIALAGFQLQEAYPLAQGLGLDAATAARVLERILDWTGGQPFLTQKVCQLVAEMSGSGGVEEWGSEAVDRLVHTSVLEHWEAQDEPEHLRTIRDRLLDDEQRMGHLLGLYQRVLQADPSEGRIQGSREEATGNVDGAVTQWRDVVEDSRDAIALLLSGLVIKQQGCLRVKNPIYRQIFSLAWIECQLEKQRPYAGAIAGWLASGQQDPSHLLRGKLLEAALNWSQNKYLNEVDYQFLNASVENDRQEVKNRLEATRLRAVEARLVQEQRINRLQRLLLGTVSFALVVASGLGIVAFLQYRYASTQEIQALTRSALARFALNQRLDALLEAVRAEQDWHRLGWAMPDSRDRVNAALQLTVYGVVEANRLSGHQAWVNGVTFSPQGNYLASASLDHTIKLWNQDGGLVATLQGHQDGVNRVAFSPDGQTLASTSYDKTIKLWKVLPGGIPAQPTQTLEGHQNTVWGVAFSPDGRLIASAGWDGTVRLWSVDGKPIALLRGHQDQVWEVVFSPDGRWLATTSSDKTIKLWQKDPHGSFQLFQTLIGHQDSVLSGAFSPDGGRLVTAGEDRVMQIWQRDRQGRFQLQARLRGHSAAIWGVAFRHDGRAIASASADGVVNLWPADSQGRFQNNTYRSLGRHSGRVWGMAFSPNGQWVASASGDNTVKLWQTRSPLLTSLLGHTDRISAVAFSLNGQFLASASRDKTVRIWRTDGALMSLLQGHQAEVNDVAIAPKGNQIATASWDRTIKLWQPDGRLVKTLAGHRDGIERIAFSPDGQLLASASYDQTIRLWRRDGTVLATLQGHRAEVNDVTFSPDGKQLVSVSGDTTVKLWAMTPHGSFTEFKTLTGHTAKVIRAKFSGDGALLATASWDRTVKLWRRDGTLLATLKGHHAAVNAVDFSPDGQFLATAGDDMTIKLWQVNGTGVWAEVVTLRSHTARVADVTFSPDGQTLASASDDNMVILWNLHEAQQLDPLAYACDWMRDYLKTNADVDENERTLCE